MTASTHNGFPSLSEQLVCARAGPPAPGRADARPPQRRREALRRRRARAQARVEIRDPRGATPLVASTNIGLAEGYMDGHWDTPDLDAVLDLGLANLVDRPAALTPPHYADPARVARAARQLAARQQAQHRGALRPGQRLLPPVARRHDDVLLGDVRRRADGPAAAAQRAQVGPPARPAAARRQGPPPRDRLRVGRLRDARRAAGRLPRHRRHALRGAARVGDAARSRRPGSRTGSTSGCRTTARCPRRTRRSRRSRCSRRSASAGGRCSSGGCATC